MTSTEISMVCDFRRFLSSHIYPETINLLLEKIQSNFSSQINFEPLPRPTIKFRIKVRHNADIAARTERVHSAMNNIFLDFFNDPIISKTIKSKIHNEIQNQDLRNILNLVLSKIQQNDYQYTTLLFNIALLNSSVYVYL